MSFEEIWPDYTQDGCPPMHGPWMQFRKPGLCVWCGQRIVGSWIERMNGEQFHFQCEHDASAAGCFKRMTGLKEDGPRITTKAHANDKRTAKRLAQRKPK